MASVRLFGRDRRPLSFRRVAAVSVLLLMAALYVGPLQKYLDSSQRLRSERAQLATLQRQHDRLAAESAALDTNAQIVVLARACGYIFPNEHPLVIRDIPASDAGQCG